jgi:preprotein translocase subunit SecA
MRVFGGERISKIMDRLNIDDETPIQNRVISKSLEGAQKKVEGFNYDSRKNVVQYDDVMNRHRRATYIMRREILKHADITNRIKEFIVDESRALVSSPDSMDEQFETMLKDIFDFDDQTIDELFEIEAEKFENSLAAKALHKHSQQTELFGEEIMNKVERDIFLQVLDNLWMQHLESMDHLRQGINWVSVGQRDPLVEYRRQSQLLFEEMQSALRHDTIRALFHARPVSQDKMNSAIETELTRAARGSVDNADKVLSGDTKIDDDDFALKDDVSATKSKVSTIKKKQKRKAAKKVRAKQRKRK